MEAITNEGENKEVSVMFGLEKFGKRPDAIMYANDVLEMAKKGASSFHSSEEIWSNPLAIRTGMKRAELDNLRIGWDLILDIDCPDWEFSKLTTHLFIRALQEHGVKNISCKFSGNKGFHIAVPFEAFPRELVVDEKLIQTKDLFPEGPRKIALYLLSYITENFTESLSEGVRFDKKYSFSIEELKKISGDKPLFAYQCLDCGKVFDKEPELGEKEFICQCGHQSKGSEDYIKCPKCDNVIVGMDVYVGCNNCNSKKTPRKIFHFFSVIEVDTILIASRHLYRMPYSLHEKTGLVSTPIDIKDILNFNKENAKPQNIKEIKSFIDRTKIIQNEAEKLLQQSLEFVTEKEKLELQNPFNRDDSFVPKEKIPEELFPPCIQIALKKPIEDGKKRTLFILMQFLRSVGWNAQEIKDELTKWNEIHEEGLRDTYLFGQLRQLDKSKNAILPPNCNNSQYYTALQICEPDNFCSRIKNPTMYSVKKHKLLIEHNKKNKKTKKKPSKKETKGENKPETIDENKISSNKNNDKPSKVKSS